MSETILQIFLNKQFIKTTDTGNIDSLNKAVTAVKALLTKKRSLLIPFTLVALDPQIPGTDPVVSEVEGLIIKNWATFKNSTSTKDKPTTYVRVVILQALAELSKDDQIAAIVWLTGRHVIDSYNTHKEKEPMADLLVKLGTQFESASRKNWSMAAPVLTPLEPLVISLTTTTGARLSQEEITNIFKAASIYSGWKPQAGGVGENPSYQHAGDWNWPKFFSERAGQGLTETINKALAGPDKSVSAVAAAIQKDINAYFAQFQGFFTEAAAALIKAASASNKRGELLWWKQALYSNRLNVSYRSLAPVAAMIAMVADFSDLVGLMHPESVNYLLKEALYDVHPETAVQKETLAGWVTKAQEVPELKTLLAPMLNDQTGRKSLGAATANALIAGDISQITPETGIGAEQELTLAELSVWLFHDLQALKLAIQK